MLAGDPGKLPRKTPRLGTGRAGWVLPGTPILSEAPACPGWWAPRGARPPGLRGDRLSSPLPPQPSSPGERLPSASSRRCPSRKGGPGSSLLPPDPGLRLASPASPSRLRPVWLTGINRSRRTGLALAGKNAAARSRRPRLSSATCLRCPPGGAPARLPLPRCCQDRHSLVRPPHEPSAPHPSLSPPPPPPSAPSPGPAPPASDPGPAGSGCSGSTSRMTPG